MREHAFERGEAIYNAVGAKKTIRTPPYPSTHNLGSCRMSAKAQDGVCNGVGQTHDIPNLFISDGSQFTTSAAENPTLTIVAMALRQSEKLGKMLKQGAV
jgi:choline dehydrogenase-like flavoprotein